MTPSFVARIGGKAIRFIRNLGMLAILLIQCLRTSVTDGLRYRREVVKQLYHIGTQSIPVVLTAGVFAGAVLAYVCYSRFDSLGAGSWTGVVTVKFLAWQIGPVLTAIVLAGRIGCAMAAEIGTMRITEQIDALETEGVNPVSYLIVPRFWASLFMTPVLIVFSVFAGILAGLFMIVFVMDGEAAFQWQQIQELIVAYDYMHAVVKGMVFGPVIALVCCMTGLKATGGAGGVGLAATNANVTSCVAIFILNLFLTMLLNRFEPHWNQLLDFARACL